MRIEERDSADAVISVKVPLALKRTLVELAMAAGYCRGCDPGAITVSIFVIPADVSVTGGAVTLSDSRPSG